MAVEIKTFEYTCSGNETEEPMLAPDGKDKLVPPEGEEYTILEVGFKLAAAGHIEGYQGERRVDNVSFALVPTDPDRVVVNRILRTSEEAKWLVTDLSGGANACAVIVVYDVRIK